MPNCIGLSVVDLKHKLDKNANFLMVLILISNLSELFVLKLINHFYFRIDWKLEITILWFIITSSDYYSIITNC